MPAVSRAQLGWVKSPKGRRALGAEGQREWIAKTDVKHLPARAPQKRTFGSGPVSRST